MVKHDEKPELKETNKTTIATPIAMIVRKIIKNQNNNKSKHIIILIANINKNKIETYLKFVVWTVQQQSEMMLRHEERDKR